MEETILVPSPNWFLVSILAAKDGWLVYGGPGKNLIVLEPLSKELDGVIDSSHRFKAHVVNNSHKERIVSVDISPDWPKKRHFISGSSDGIVKEWAFSQVDNKSSIKIIHSHEAHFNEKEDVVAVSYSMGTHAVSVGSFCNVVVWELNTNVTRMYDSFLKRFKATCMSSSPHLPLVVAVGTKQGVVFVLDLNGNGKLLYKVRGQDDEISQVSWCPQYEVTLKRSLTEGIRKSLVTQRMEKIRNERDPADLEASGIEKNLPDDSFDESVVKEDDTFDIYKDHEAEEFGHKKYEPENIFVKIKDDSKQDDFLAECMKLKEKILKNKTEEESIESLVEAMDKTHVDEGTYSKVGGDVQLMGAAITGEPVVASGSQHSSSDASAHIHRHLLASVGKYGSVRVWSKSGKIVSTCTIQVKNNNKQNQYTPKGPNHSSICWYKPESLLICDGKTQVLECNPLKIDCKNKLEWHPVHSHHRRGMYCIITDAPRVQTAEMLADPHHDDQWNIWTVGQDRYLIKYSMKHRKMLAKHGTCGGFLYAVSPCPYDAGKLAIGVGDGAIRIWETHSTGEDDSKIALGEVNCYWQNVQGKILQCAWHPTKENLIAFSTAESRVGLLDVGSKVEKPARVLQPALTCGVYSLAWGEDMALFAVGGGELVMYHANKRDDAPISIRIEIEGQKWDLSAVNYSRHGLMVGSNVGGVALFDGPAGKVLAAKFVYTKMIHMIEWHPQQTTSSDEDSKYKNLVALCSLDKNHTIVILEYVDREDGGKQFNIFNELTGHLHNVLQVAWSPHREGLILSTSQDATVRVWDAARGVCVSIFGGHASAALGAAWCPRLAGRVLSGSGDCCLRLWDINNHPKENFEEIKREKRKRKKLQKNKKKGFGRVGDEEKESDEEKEKEDTHNSEEETDHVAEALKEERRFSKKFLLPIISRQVSTIKMNGPRIMLQKYIEKHQGIKNIMDIMKEDGAELYDLDFLKLFGTINEINEVLDMECRSHLTQKTYDAYIMLMIFRGHIDSVIQFANEHDLLDSFLLSIAPCVSFKYWKDVTQLYVSQIDRFAAKDQDEKLYENKKYGGVHYRKAAALLAIHDVKGAVEVLWNAKMWKEAYILCRCRHMDSIAEDTISKWAFDAGYTGNLMLGALINISLGKLSNAANMLRRSKEQEILNLAAELAKLAGLNTFADYIETMVKSAEKEQTDDDKTEQILDELPTRIELLMKKNQNESKKGENGSDSSDSEDDSVSHKAE